MPIPDQELAEARLRATEFVKYLSDRYSSYFHHKESMAFTGLTLYVGAIAATLVSDSWPPWWGYSTLIWALIALGVLWVGVLIYLRFQLQRRRWAAVRIAGCEHILATWILSPPTREDLTPTHRTTPPEKLSHWQWIWDWFSPQSQTKPIVAFPKEGDPAVYPAVLIAEWLRLERKMKDATEAVKHDRLVIAAGWITFFSVMLYTWWKKAHG